MTMMNGDIDRAVQLLLTRAEMGQDIKPNQTQVKILSTPHVIHFYLNIVDM